MTTSLITSLQGRDSVPEPFRSYHFRQAPMQRKFFKNSTCYYLSLMWTKNFTQQWINNNCLKKKTEQKKLNSQ